jgi:bifunctional non-homologous end joining protein LigD
VGGLRASQNQGESFSWLIIVTLKKYEEKRRFDRTPEPRGKKARTAGPLRFVVQKHQASRLHYDFRLELDGTLKSWAVPKGPSLNPQDKRLAIMVEDHPLDYRTFEGTIPKGNYGAGTVMVWDEGPYCSRQTADPKVGERLIREGLAKGHLTILLFGKKLKGEFALIKLKRGQENAWLLVKKDDAWASDADVTNEDRSALTGRRMEEITKGKPRRRKQANRGARGAEARDSLNSPVLTNLDKVYWPEEGYTKGDLIAYYRDLASVILPYLRDRPMSLHRHPNGIAAKSFYQKDVSRQPPPDWVRTITLPTDSGKGHITYLLCQDEASLLYVANLGCIEMNPWNSRVGTLEKPDYLVIDLDPENVPFQRVVEAAIAVRKTLEKAGAKSLCKTSGKRGLHVYVPLSAHYSNDQARQFAEIIATLVNQKLPASTSLTRSPSLRQGRVYLDYLQNRRGQTLAAPYSVRPQPGATVSTPLRWDEVNNRVDPGRFTMRTIGKRLDKLGDLWKPVLGPGIDLAACLDRLHTDHAPNDIE